MFWATLLYVQFGNFGSNFGCTQAKAGGDGNAGDGGVVYIGKNGKTDVEELT
jgi:hypothetical protein